MSHHKQENHWLWLVSLHLIHNNSSGSFNCKKLRPLSAQPASFSQNQRVKCNIPHPPRKYAGKAKRKSGVRSVVQWYGCLSYCRIEWGGRGALDNSHHSRIPSFIHYRLQLHMPSSRAFIGQVEMWLECFTLICWESLPWISLEWGWLNPNSSVCVCDNGFDRWCCTVLQV